LVLLTGDTAGTAQVVGRQVDLTEIQAELLPEDKVKAIDALVAKYGKVAMIGDGVNDAPAMARATLGIAMGAMGSDAAIETADIALMKDDLTRRPWLIHHSRRTLKVIRQNITFALAVKAVFVVLTLMGHASLWSAIAADMGASLLVIFNGLRLLRSSGSVPPPFRRRSRLCSNINPGNRWNQHREETPRPDCTRSFQEPMLAPAWHTRRPGILAVELQYVFAASRMDASGVQGNRRATLSGICATFQFRMLEPQLRACEEMAEASGRSTLRKGRDHCSVYAREHGCDSVMKGPHLTSRECWVFPAAFHFGCQRPCDRPGKP
jgi:hypothetical protein